MRLEKLNLSNSKGKIRLVYLSGFITAIALIIIVNVIASKALYRKTESVQLATGTVNYSPADFSVLAVYLQATNADGSGQEGKYNRAKNDEIPSTGYDLNTQKSYCTAGTSNERVWGNGYTGEAKVTVEYKNGSVNFTNITKSNTKCYLWFDVMTSGTSDRTLAKLRITPLEGEIGEITGPSCGQSTCYSSGKISMQQNGLYEAGEDDDGTTYVYRGTVSDNWVKFGQTTTGADIWWRIIRFNGDGTIRMIFSGTTTGSSTPSATGDSTQISTSAYNTEYGDNTYVGYYIGTKGSSSYDDTHSNKEPSTIAGVVNNWFSKTTKLNQEPYRSQIDENSGFCNDREINTTSKWWKDEGDSNRGTGQVVTTYGPFQRFFTTGNSWRTDKNEPTLKCKQKDKDLYTLKHKASQGNKVLDYPVGLITADEVVFAGGYGGQNNNSYWLYTNQYYWTMSPSLMHTDGKVFVFTVDNDGHLNNNGVYWTTPGVRPVINLKPENVTLQNPSGENKGTTTNPYIVSD